MIYGFRVVLFSLLLGLSTMACGQGSGLPRILDATQSDDNYLPDFSYAGFENGNSPLPTASGQVIRVADFGAVPDDGKDDESETTTLVLSPVSKVPPSSFRVTPMS